ncbi:meprin A subunit beta isoform X1 [Petromyzon marinus]|uniref:meprin A subunit beta isoform X1 n=1 Tax=Petromyzon marinus TaxID=7757 RepID=UPI003F6FC273
MNARIHSTTVQQSGYTPDSKVSSSLKTAVTRCMSIEDRQRTVEKDVDEGQKWDIFDVNKDMNLIEGDIAYDQVYARGRSAVRDDRYRWPKTIPYYLDISLDVNAKGVIMQAFEMYRLKTCIDFKPWAGEREYIQVIKGSGCWSYVGNLHYGKQELSIGANCDRLGTVEHEFLHALGFWHEQSRADRDDYVTIVWDQILNGREGNFDKYEDDVTDLQNVPYDYSSMMHYGASAFQKAEEPTIVTRIPDFMQVIGQRSDFSKYDLQKLNRLYNCTRSLAFMEQCNFEELNICGMIQGAGDTLDWQQVTSAVNGPASDFTHLTSCPGKGSFMFMNTSVGTNGSRGLLETRTLVPKRQQDQCLQFYYSGSSGQRGDKLGVHVRVGNSTELKEVMGVTDFSDARWKFVFHPLAETQPFRVVFEGVKGSATSPGGIAIDDVSIMEVKCPTHMWRIQNFSQVLASSPSGPGGTIYSPRFESGEGYNFQISMYVNGTSDNPGNLALYFHLMSGDKDNSLTWPCPWKQATMSVMDQHWDVGDRMSRTRSVTTDPKYEGTNPDGTTYYYWDRPDKVGSLVSGEKYFRGPGLGTSSFMSHHTLLSRNYVKGDELMVLIAFADVAHLVAEQPRPSATAKPPVIPGQTTLKPGETKPLDPCTDVECLNDGVCLVQDGNALCFCPPLADGWYKDDRCKRGSDSDIVIPAAVTGVVVFVVMLAASGLTFFLLKRKNKKRAAHKQAKSQNATNL